MNKLTRERIFSLLAEAIPEPKTELVYHSHFELLIAVILSAQATDVRVNLATRPLFAAANTPESMHQLGEEGLKQYIKSIGLYNSKAKNIIATAKQLITHHQSLVPSDRVSLEALPGVGRKTANVVLNVAFNQPTMAVDTHVFRVSNRSGIARGKTPLAVEKKLIQTIPKSHMTAAHHLLILHGRYTCKARNPHCENCIIASLCEYPHKNITSEPASDH